MSTDRMIAGHMQDVVVGLEHVERAVRSTPPPNQSVEVAPTTIVVNVPTPIVENKASDTPPPVVNVTVPTPVVNVAAPQVTVDVPAPAPTSYRVTVTARDDQGLIRSFVIEPI